MILFSLFRISPNKSPVKDRREPDRDKVRDRSPLTDKKKLAAPSANDKGKSKEKHDR